MIIINGKVLNENFCFQNCSVLFSSDTINSLEYNTVTYNDEIIDADGGYVIPGLIDLHFHGALGYDVCDCSLEAYRTIAAYELQSGITSICPAMLTLPEDVLKNALSIGKNFADNEGNDYTRYSELIGFNMEGPFISPIKKGAQNEKYITKANPEMVDRFIKASGGLLKIIGLAPEETDNYQEYIEKVKDKVIISLAHTNSDYETARNAFDHGASHAVHLYNAMTGLNHRSPGVVGAVFDSDHVTAEIICDGIHIHPAAVRIAFEAVGPDRMVLVSDSLRCAGLDDGIYDLGGQDVRKEGPYCRLVEGGSIAGSVSNLFECMVNAVKIMGISLETAAKAASYNPARVLSVDDHLGSIAKGKQADLLILDKYLNLKHIIKKGKLIK